jgi:addiction module HigA family antidote
MLLEEYLKPAGLTQTALAARMGVPVRVVNALVHGRRPITVATALKLGKALKTAPQFWLNCQRATDLWHAARRPARPSARTRTTG